MSTNRPVPLPTVEYVSPYARDEEAADYAKDPFWQYENLKAALYKVVTGGAGNHFHDLRGRSFAITVGQDGHTVTVTDTTNG